MFEIIQNLVDEHLCMLEELYNVTTRIHAYARSSNVGPLVNEVENRERLMNILEHLQNKVTGLFDNFRVLNEEERQRLVKMAKSWQMKVDAKIHAIDQLNASILEELDQQKLQTLKEVFFLHQSKEKFKGYNLNNVKR